MQRKRSKAPIIVGLMFFFIGLIFKIVSGIIGSSFEELKTYGEECQAYVLEASEEGGYTKVQIIDEDSFYEGDIVTTSQYSSSCKEGDIVTVYYDGESLALADMEVLIVVFSWIGLILMIFGGAIVIIRIVVLIVTVVILGVGIGSLAHEQKQQEQLNQYNQNTYGQNQYNQQGYNPNQYNQQGYNQGYPTQGNYNQNAGNYNSQNAYGQNQYNQQGYNQSQYNQQGYNQGYPTQGGYNQNTSNYNQNPYNNQNNQQ